MSMLCILRNVIGKHVQETACLVATEDSLRQEIKLCTLSDVHLAKSKAMQCLLGRQEVG